jgi:hypothetical protein
MATVQDVKNPIYVTTTPAPINCDVLFEGNVEYLPFTASPNDPEEYGRQLYAQLLAGDWGPVSPYIPPPPPPEPTHYALISPNDKIYDSTFTPPVVLGYRVVEVATVQSTQPAPLYWVACPDYVTPNGYYYTGSGFSAY